MMKQLTMGAARLALNTLDFSWARRAQIQEGLVEVKLKNSLFSKHPLLDGEDIKAWEERIKPELEAKAQRKSKENSNAYLTRLMTGDSNKQEMLYDTLTLIAKTFNQSEKVTPENFAVTSYPDAKVFVSEILSLYDLDASSFE